MPTPDVESASGVTWPTKVSVRDLVVKVGVF
jgi:hypothetical protein